MSKDLWYNSFLPIALLKKDKTSLTPIGCVLVFSHLGAIIKGSFSTKSLIISNEELPDPTIIPALKVVRAYCLDWSVFSTFFLERRCLDNLVSLWEM